MFTAWLPQNDMFIAVAAILAFNIIILFFATKQSRPKLMLIQHAVWCAFLGYYGLATSSDAYRNTWNGQPVEGPKLSGEPVYKLMHVQAWFTLHVGAFGVALYEALC